MILRLILALAMLFPQGTTVGPKVTLGPKVTIAPGSGGGSAITVRHTISVDSSTVNTVAALDFGQTIPAGSGVVLAITMAGGAGNNTTSVCDATTTATCTSSASTYTILARNSSPGGTNTQFAYTCNAAASVRYFTVNWVDTADETISIVAFNHSVTSGCLDQHPTGVSGTAGSTVTSGTYTTAVANEIAVAVFGDDSNNGPAWTGSAGSGFTALASSPALSMLGVMEYQVYASTQSSVTATLTTGNSSGHDYAFDVATFE